jgi:hypothetical protein
VIRWAERCCWVADDGKEEVEDEADDAVALLVAKKC